MSEASLRRLLRSALPRPIHAVLHAAGTHGLEGLRRALQVRSTPSNDCWFVGRYASWSAASSDCDGYAAPVILQRVRESSAKARDEPEWFERDGVLFSAPQWNFPLLALLLRIASRRGNQLHVVDIGGSLGSTYRHVRAFLGDAVALRWSIVEQASFVTLGRSEFQTSELRFFSTIADLRSAPACDVVLLSAVLPYVAEPYGMLEQAATLSAPHLIIDRHPLTDEPRDRISVQHVPAAIYGAPVRYPAWLFSRRAFTERTSAHWRIALETEGTDATLPADDGLISFRTLLLER